MKVSVIIDSTKFGFPGENSIITSIWREFDEYKYGAYLSAMA